MKDGRPIQPKKVLKKSVLMHEWRDRTITNLGHKENQWRYNGLKRAVPYFEAPPYLWKVSRSQSYARCILQVIHQLQQEVDPRLLEATLFWFQNRSLILPKAFLSSIPRLFQAGKTWDFQWRWWHIILWLLRGLHDLLMIFLSLFTYQNKTVKRKEHRSTRDLSHYISTLSRNKKKCNFLLNIE